LEFLAGFHPMIVHFPIVLFLLYFLFELIGVFFPRFEDSALLVLFLGIVTGVIAVLTGNQAAGFFVKNFTVNDLTLEAIEEHEFLATLLLWYFFGILIYRYYLRVKKKLNGKIKYILLFLTIIGSILVYQTGAAGGKLVYEHGVGVVENLND